MYNAEILLDSVNPAGSRLTTMRVTMPRIILAEFNTHRKFSRNSASSRAISVKRRIDMVENNPFIPLEFGKNEKSMHSLTTIAETTKAEQAWRAAARAAVYHASQLERLDVHKQVANRLLEPFLWTTVIVSSTDYMNFFALRCSPLAQPEIRHTANLMREAINNSTPTMLQWYEWHTPMATEKEVAVGRIARVSYEANPKTDDEERALCEQLKQHQHWSPFEHIAMASPSGKGCRNFDDSWTQWRSLFDEFE